MDKSVQNGIVDSFTHMPVMHGRHFARCFCRYSGNIASDISMHNKKIISLYKENGQRKSTSVFRYAYLSVFSHPSIPFY